MTTSLVDGESLLAIDIGSVHSRASLFDVVDNQYHFIASGVSPSTYEAPIQNIMAGANGAIKQLEEICGRNFLNENDSLILPSDVKRAMGVDRLVVTFSAGPQLKVIVSGLLAGVSLESANRLARTVSGKISETIGLNDNRSMDMQIDVILQAKPDLFILTGGTEQGASRSVFKLVELITFVCRILPEGSRPEIIYAGNQVLGKKIKEVLEHWSEVKLAPNVRPEIGVENLEPAKEVLSRVVTKIRHEQLSGLNALTGESSVYPMPASHAFGSMVQFLSHLYDPQKGILAVDLGAGSTTFAAGVSGSQYLNVFPYGLGQGLEDVLKESRLVDILQWLPQEIAPEDVRDYLNQKKLFPGSIPATTETLMIEQALARHILRLATKQFLNNWPALRKSFEPYVATGSVITRAARPEDSLLILLDGLQPVGITTFVLDQNGIMASLGAAARINSLMPVQVLETGAFLNLGTVISPLSTARYGTKILRVHIEFEDGKDSRFEVKKGTLARLPLEPGQVARIHLEALRRSEIDPYGRSRTGSFKIVGGICGAVIDARGRPLSLPPDEIKRRELLQRWSTSLKQI